MMSLQKVGKFALKYYRYCLLKWDAVAAFLAIHSGQAKWIAHLILIVGVPKSGTNWMAQLLEQIPGFKRAIVFDPDDCNDSHDICNDIFLHLPQNAHYVMKLHTQYSTSNVEVLERFNIRPVIMYRDIRDLCVSRYYHVLNDPTHRHHAQYNSSPQDDSIMHCINQTIERYLPWIENWRLAISKQPERFFVINYETLRQDAGLVLSRVLDYYEIDLPRETINGIVQKIASRTKFDLRENLRTRKGTARKGVVGDWRNHFNPDHVRLIKEKCGQHLIDLGYERDFAWSND